MGNTTILIYRPIGIFGQTVCQNGTGRTAADHYEIVLVLDLGGPAVRHPVMDVLDVWPKQQYGYAYEYYVTDAGPVRHGDAGGQPGRERVRRHGVTLRAATGSRRPAREHCNAGAYAIAKIRPTTSDSLSTTARHANVRDGNTTRKPNYYRVREHKITIICITNYFMLSHQNYDVLMCKKTREGHVKRARRSLRWDE